MQDELLSDVYRSLEACACDDCMSCAYQDFIQYGECQQILLTQTIDLIDKLLLISNSTEDTEVKRSDEQKDEICLI